MLDESLLLCLRKRQKDWITIKHLTLSDSINLRLEMTMMKKWSTKKKKLMYFIVWSFIWRTIPIIMENVWKLAKKTLLKWLMSRIIFVFFLKKNILPYMIYMQIKILLSLKAAMGKNTWNSICLTYVFVNVPSGKFVRFDVETMK